MSNFRTCGIEIVPDGFTAQINCLWGTSIRDGIEEVFRVMRSGTFRFRKYVIHHNEEVVVITEKTSERRVIDYVYRKIFGCSEQQFNRNLEEYLKNLDML